MAPSSYLKDCANVFSMRKEKILARSFEYEVNKEGNLKNLISMDSALMKIFLMSYLHQPLHNKMELSNARI